jgi:hypothetical protein
MSLSSNISQGQCMNAIAFASTFYFFSTHKANAQKNKKSLQSNAHEIAKFQCKPYTTAPRTDRRAADNTGLAKVAVQCSADTFVVNQSLVLRINICGENPPLRQAAKR